MSCKGPVRKEKAVTFQKCVRNSPVKMQCTSHTDSKMISLSNIYIYVCMYAEYFLHIVQRNQAKR